MVLARHVECIARACRGLVVPVQQDELFRHKVESTNDAACMIECPKPVKRVRCISKSEVRIPRARFNPNTRKHEPSDFELGTLDAPQRFDNVAARSDDVTNFSGTNGKETQCRTDEPAIACAARKSNGFLEHFVRFGNSSNLNQRPGLVILRERDPMRVAKHTVMLDGGLAASQYYFVFRKGPGDGRLRVTELSENARRCALVEQLPCVDQPTPPLQRGPVLPCCAQFPYQPLPQENVGATGQRPLERRPPVVHVILSQHEEGILAVVEGAFKPLG